MKCGRYNGPVQKQKAIKKSSLQLVLAMVIVGSTFVVAKTLTATLPLFLANSLRFSIAAVALLPMLVKRWPEVRQVRPLDMKRLLLSAAFGVFLFNILLFWGLRYVSAGTSGVITSFAPIAITVLSVLFLKEKISHAKIAASVVATVGLVVINFYASSTGGTGGSRPLGVALIFGVVLCDALFTLLAKSAARRVAPEVMTLLVVYFSCLLFLPFGAWQAIHFHFSSLGAKDWLLLLYLGTIVNALSYFLWYSGLKRVSANQAAVFTGIMPISSLVLAAIFLKERVLPLQALGLVFVLAGIFLATQSPAKQAPPLRSEEEYP